MTLTNDVSPKTASLPLTLEQLAISFYRIWDVCDVTSGMMMSATCHMTQSVPVGTIHTDIPTKTIRFHSKHKKLANVYMVLNI